MVVLPGAVLMLAEPAVTTPPTGPARALPPKSTATPKVSACKAKPFALRQNGGCGAFPVIATPARAASCGVDRAVRFMGSPQFMRSLQQS
jgi:hypothetical protein